MSNLTMADIAKKAGVSLTTVGRVVRGSGYVSQQKKEIVEKVIKESGYVPNRAAQGLKSSKSNLIGHLTLLNNNLLYEEISKSLNQAAKSKGYQVLTYTSDSEISDKSIILDELIAQQVAGIVITSFSDINKEMLQKVLIRKIPLVMIERTIAIEGADRVVVSDYSGAFDAVEYLINMGHRRIGFIGLNKDHHVENSRLNGYLAALESANIEVDNSIIFKTVNYGVEEGREVAKILLNSREDVTSVFMTSDLFACGFMQECYKRKIRIPDDISIVGYDNTLSMMLSPPVTSVSLDLKSLGESTMDLLLSRMDNRELLDREIINKTSVVKRDSVKRIN